MQTANDESPRSPFLARLIATGLFSGYIPWASGTFGSLVGLIIYFVVPTSESSFVLAGMIVAGFVAGVISSASVARTEGHRLTRTAEIAKSMFQQGQHEAPDPSIVVIDEIVGMWVTLLFLPKTVPVLVLAFVAFRAFDIVKPIPARQLERLPNGWGIMLDDIVAGIYANASLQVAMVLFATMLP